MRKLDARWFGLNLIEAVINERHFLFHLKLQSGKELKREKFRKISTSTQMMVREVGEKSIIDCLFLFENFAVYNNQKVIEKIQQNKECFSN